MSWDGVGNFTRALGSNQWANDAAAHVGIEAAIHDTQDNDLATGINNCLTKDGQNAPTANLPMGSFRHTTVGDATVRTHYAKVSQTQDNTYIYGGTSGGSANAQTLTLSIAISAYATGQVFYFKAGFTNTASTTINVSAVGAKTVKRQNGRTLIGNEIITGYVYAVMYDGTDLILLNPASEWQTWAPSSWTGFSVNPSGIFRYKILPDGNSALIHVRITSAGTSNGTQFKFDAPVTAKNTASDAYTVRADGLDNSAYTSHAQAYMLANTAIIECSLSGSSTGWTAAGTKSVGFTLVVEL